jgi:cytochrome P450
MRGYILDLLRAKRGRMDDHSLLARIARARRDGIDISDEEAVGLTLQLFVAGNETTTSLITNFMWRMLSGDNLWADFRAGAPPFATLDDCAAAASLIDAIYAATKLLEQRFLADHGRLAIQRS